VVAYRGTNDLFDVGSDGMIFIVSVTFQCRSVEFIGGVSSDSSLGVSLLHRLLQAGASS